MGGKTETKGNRVLASLRNSMDSSSHIVRLALATVVIFVFMSVVLGNQFLNPTSLYSIASQMPELLLYATGISMAMILGGIDLSAVGLGNLGGLFAILIMQSFGDAIGPLPATLLAVLVALLVGAVGGALNGLIISKLGIPAMLATLGTNQLFLGLVYIITGGTAIFGVTDEFSFIGNGKLLGLPFQMIVVVLILFYLIVVFQRQVLGKQLYLVGTNGNASIFAGINKDAVFIKTHMIVGLLAAVGGLILCSRSASIKADYGESYTMQCILIAVLGGINPAGGFGSLGGVLLATIALQFLSTGLNMFHVSPMQKEMVWGVLLVMFMLLNYYGDQSKNRKKVKLVKQITETNQASNKND